MVNITGRGTRGTERGAKGGPVSSQFLYVVLADVMQGGGGYKVLTAGLLRVELAPEEYQLYSEGCGWGRRRRRRRG